MGVVRRFRVLVAISLVGSLLLGMGVVPLPTLAASIEVGSSAAYPCTRQGLGDAIQAAGSGGRVTFNCNPAEIEFSAGEQISISVDVTIDGNNGSGEQMVLDGNEATRFFDVVSGTLALQHITLRDGKADNGGALRLDLVGQMEIIDTTFISNQATIDGGAIWNRSPVTISQSRFIGNHAEGGGGAIFGVATLIINQTSFADNQAADRGGAIYNHSLYNSILTETSFTNNNANHAGAIANEDGYITINQSSFIDNEATYTGGAIRSAGDLPVNINQSSFTNNRAQSGGALYNMANQLLTITQSSFINNEAEVMAGAIYEGGDSIIRECRFINNTSGGLAGAIANHRRFSAILQSSFIDNHADGIGGAILGWAKTTIIASSTFIGNTADEGASAIDAYASEDDFTIAWSTIVQPEATTPAVSIPSSTVFIGVMLGGDGAHCLFNGGSLNVSGTLANDDSCDPNQTADWENQNLRLGPLSTTAVNGVEQRYYPLIEGSPAIDRVPGSCDFEISEYYLKTTVNTDQLGTLRPVNGSCDVGAIEGAILYPAELCANGWNGAVSMPGRGGCGRGDTLIELPWDGPIGLCVNQWNGATRVAEGCSRSEYAMDALGDHSIPTCVNRWNGTLRVSERCSRSEQQGWL